MAGRIDQVQNVGLAVLGRVFNPHSIGLDGDPAFALDIHRVKQLLFHIPLGHSAGQLDQPIRQGGFAVVDMRHDGEVTNARKLGHVGPRLCVQ